MSEQAKKSIVPPTDAEIAGNIDAYTYQIDEIILVPRIKVFKDGKLMRVIDSAQQVKYAGTINGEYADTFLSDIVSDFKSGFAQAMAQHMMKQQNQQGSSQ